MGDVVVGCRRSPQLGCSHPVRLAPLPVAVARSGVVLPLAASARIAQGHAARGCRWAGRRTGGERLDEEEPRRSGRPAAGGRRRQTSHDPRAGEANSRACAVRAVAGTFSPFVAGPNVCGV